MKINRQLHKILLGILLICVSNGFAQLLKQKDRYTVYINYPAYSIKTTVSNSNERIKTKESLTYYWYSSNKIMQTKGDYEGKIVDGPYISFYLSNNLKEKGEFKKGLKNGKWISWYEDGKINEITNWKNGERSGEYKKYNQDETLNLIAHYRHDQLNGKQISYKDNKPDSVKTFKNGTEVIVKQKDKGKEKDKQGPSFLKKAGSFFKTKKNDAPKEIKPAPDTQKEDVKEEKAITAKKKKKSKQASDKQLSSSEKQLKDDK